MKLCTSEAFNTSQTPQKNSMIDNNSFLTPDSILSVLSENLLQEKLQSLLQRLEQL